MANLTAGSIAFTGFNGDGNDNLSFVVLTDIAANTTINFADKTWNGSSFASNEGTWSWTATSAVSAGTIIQLNNVGGTISTNNGSVSGGSGLSNDSEVVYAFTGTTSAPGTFLAAISNSGFGTSAAPGDGTLAGTGLVAGQTAVSLSGGVDIMAYNGTHTGQTSFAGYLSIINNSANWISQNSGKGDSADGTEPNAPFPTTGFAVTAPAGQTISFSTPTVSVNEGNSGTQTLTFTVTRGTDTTGDVSFSGTFNQGTTNAADYANGTLPSSTFTGTIPAGATSANVTVTISGDTTPESNESFTLTLTSASNPSSSVTISTATATGTIANDDGTVVSSNSSTGITLANNDQATILSGVTLSAPVTWTGGSASPGAHLDNFGTISTSSNAINSGSVNGNLTIDNEVGATITTTKKDGIHIDGLSSGTVTVNNAGTIQATGTGDSNNGQAIDFDKIASSSAHSVINNASTGIIQAADADAIRPGTNSTINNHGLIKSLNGNDAIDFQDVNTGGVVNNFTDGTIDGTRHGITGKQNITVTNDGIITGEAGSGINLDTTSGTTTITNTAHGIITGVSVSGADADGIDVDNLVSIDNFGVINAVGLTSSANGLNEALAIGGGFVHNEVGGVINSDQRAITVDDSDDGNAFGATTILNEGTIRGNNGEAIYLNSTFADTITNKGVITGSVAMGGGDDTFNAYAGSTTSGLIDSGAGNDTINLLGTGPGTLGANQNFENLNVESGIWTIASAAYADVTVATGAIVMSQIKLADQGEMSVASNGVIQVTNGDNAVVASGSADIDNSGSILALGAGASAIVINGGSIDNAAGGTITANGTAIVSGAAAVAGVAISNEGVIQGQSGQAIALVGNQNDTLTNQGQIIGNVSLGGGDDTLNVYTGSTITGTTDLGDGNDTVHLLGTGGTFGTVANAENLDVDQGTWTVDSAGTYDAINIAAGATLTSQILVTDSMSVTVGGTLEVSDDRAITADDGLADGSTLTVDVLKGGTIVAGDDAIRIKGDFDNGVITIDNAGAITATGGQAIDLTDVTSHSTAITITNEAKGVILAVDADAVRAGGNTTIDNYGQILSQATGDDVNDGIDFQDDGDGTVTNYAGASITGAHHGITGSKGITVINELGGTIIGQSGSAVNIDNDGSVANTVTVTNYGIMLGQANPTQADSDGDAVDVDGLLKLDNYGQISGLGANGTHDGGANVSEGVAIGGGTINNYAGATIYGYGRAIQVDNSADGPALAATTIYNEGTIQGDGNGPVNFDPGSDTGIVLAGREAIDILGSFADTITNTAAGQITGGIFTDGGNDVLSNAGTITGQVNLGDGDDTFNAYVGSTVSGTIDGGDGNDTIKLYATAGSTATGVLGATANVETLDVVNGNWVFNSYFAGANIDVGNGAAIVSTMTLLGGQTLTVEQGGLVQGANGAIGIGGGAVDALVVNNGTIDVTATWGTKADAITLTNASATIHNGATGDIEGARHAITGSLGITVINDAGGTIVGHNGSAVNMDNDASVANTAHVTNYGTMLGDSANISDSDGDAIDADGLLQLENYGMVRGEGANGYHKGEANVSEGVAAGGGTINNYAGATIYGYGRAIQIDNSSNAAAYASTTIYNEGTIQGGGNGPTSVSAADAAAMQARINGGEAIDILGTFADTITNTATGKIIGGIFTDGGNDVLSNAGSITAMAGSAINMGDGDDTVTLSGNSQVTGNILLGAGNDTLTDTGHTAITVDAGTGNDSITVGTGNDILIGGDGSDNFHYALGDGNDTIVEGVGQAGDVDQLYLSGVDASGVTLVRNGNDLDITMSDGHQIVVQNQFAGGGVEDIVLGDGTVIDRGDIVGETNHAPVVTSPTTAVTDEDTPLTGQVKATDADGDTLSYTLVGDGAGHGTVTLDAQGNWTYTPASNYNGGDSFSVSISDGHTTTTTTVDLTINPVNDLPVTVNDTGHVSEHDTATFDLVGNDTDVEDGHPSLAGFTVAGVNGDISVSADAASNAFHIVNGQLVYDDSTGIFSGLNDGQSETVTINYTAQDSDHGTATGQFTLTIDGVTDLNPINGTGGSDVLFDTNGNDHISGGDGSDVIFTSAGSDVVDAGSGDDMVTALTGSATVNGGDGNDTIVGGSGNTVLNGDNGNDTIIGGSGNEVINGGVGNDTLIGNAGDDRIIGGQGNDTLIGGAGSDTFVFKPGDGQDTVLDFQASGSSHDVVEVDTHAFADFTSLMAAVHDTASGAQLQYADGSSITLTGVTKSHLTVDDFHFA